MGGRSCLSRTERQYHDDLTELTAAALYYYHQTSAIERISTLPNLRKDQALYSICRFIFSKTLWDEPYEKRSFHAYKIKYEEALDICGILEYMNTDTCIYDVINDLVNSISSKINTFSFSRQQKDNIRDKLKEIIAAKLPDSNNIKHSGFKIIAEAQVLTLENSGEDRWRKLVDQVAIIDNISDRGYIYPILAYAIPTKYHDLRKICLEKSISAIQTIPAVFDKIDRYIHVADYVQSVDENTARTMLRAAMESSVTSDAPETVHQQQKRVIDIANRISPEYAKEMADLFDCDPARIKARIDSLLDEPDEIIARFGLHEHLEVLKVKDKMLEKYEKADDDASDDYLYSQAMWKLLGSLNANLVNPIPVDRITESLIAASRLPLSKAYPIYAWAVVNIVKRLENTPAAFSNILPIFQSLVALSNFTVKINSKAKDQIADFEEFHIEPEHDVASIVVEPGERDKAVDFIRQWLLKELGNFIWISDPYFSKNELDYLNLIKSVNNECEVSIITSDKGQKPVVSNLDEEYRAHWKNITDEKPPDTQIIIASKDKHGNPPIHDRFWLTNNSGLKFGESLNGVGVSKMSTISVMHPQEHQNLLHEFKPFVTLQKKTYNGQTIKYMSFSL